jgi:type VI secretion system secreted protein VgrG
MADGMKQAGRIARLTTPLGADELVLTQLHVSEGLSELFEISIEALSKTEDFDFDRLLGQACTVTFEQFHGATRHFNGVMTGAEWHGQDYDGHTYRLTLRPWLWLLGQTSDCRIFHKKTVLDILKEVFRDRGFQQDVRDATSESYPKIEYCVQYRETDLNFVQRLMEQFGIYYFFEHSDGRHVLVLADAKSSHKPVEKLTSLHYQPQNVDDRHDRQSVGYWVSGRMHRTGKVALNDYNFETPTANLLADKSMPEGHSHDAMERYDYPGRYPARSEGTGIAQARVEAARALDRRRSGSGPAPSLAPGGLIKLEGHPRRSENVEFLVLRCRHTFRTEAYRSSGAASGGGVPYSGAYEFLPSERRFRAAEVTPKPVVHGPQTAVVIGDQGDKSEEIDVDKYGRILVRFHWDRKKGQSCRVRVAQVWAGKSWGGQVIPRLGQEVVVEFLEGDPDRPLVTGAVYNADNMPPYTLPDNKTMAGVKSNSTKGGNGYNEFVFEDKKGSEKIRMHAEKDHEVKIEDSETVKIVKDRTHTIEQGNDKLTVSIGKQDVSIGMSRKTDVKVMDELHVGVALKISSDAVVQVSANAAIQLAVGGSSIAITPAGIIITAPMTIINGPVTMPGPLALGAGTVGIPPIPIV